MKESIFKNKVILGVNEEPDILEIIEEEILNVCPACRFDKATNYQQAVERMMLLIYDLVVFGDIGAGWFDLLELASARHFPAVVLSDDELRPEALERLLETGVLAYLPIEQLGEIVPFLRAVLKDQSSSELRNLLVNFRRFFNTLPKMRIIRPQYILEMLRKKHSWI